MRRVVLAIAVMAVSTAAAETLVVGAGRQFASVRDAIEAAHDGDTIRIEAGVYPGNLVLKKRLSLAGDGSPVIRGEGKGSVITIHADGCEVRGLVIEHSGGELVREDSGVLLHSSGNRIEHNTLNDVLFGVYFYAADRNVVAHNTIRGRDSLDVGDRGSGIHVYRAAHNEILNNTISGTRDGMYLQNADESSIRGNNVTNVRYGLHYMYSNDNTFEDNSFSHNVAGAAIMYSHRISLRRNRFVRNRGVSSFGILFQDAEQCTAEDNVIVGNGIGIFMEALRGSTFRRNLIAANDLAIQVFSSATGNTFEANNFIDNLSPVQVVGRKTDTVWSGTRHGNYWSEYEGYDLDEDGAGDVPFKIQNVFQYLEGQYPRIRIYLFSPASQALAAAEKAFPVFEGSREFDQQPLMKPVELTIPSPEKQPSAAFPSLMFSAAMLLTPAVAYLKGKRP